MLELRSAYVSKISTMADKSLRIVLDTPELDSETMANIFKAYSEGQQGITIGEVEVKGGKSPSRLMRDCIYRLWETTNQNKDFETFYKIYMDKLCDKIKSQIL